MFVKKHCGCSTESLKQHQNQEQHSFGTCFNCAKSTLFKILYMFVAHS